MGRDAVETDLQYYTRLVIEELRAAGRADAPEKPRAHELRANAFTLQMHRLENMPTASNPTIRLRPLPLAA